MDSPEALPWLGLKHEAGGGVSLTVQLLMISKGGSTLTRNFDNVAPGAQARVIPVTLIYGKNGRGEPRFQQICVF